METSKRQTQTEKIMRNLPKSIEVSDKKIASLLFIGEMFSAYRLADIKKQAELKGFDLIAQAKSLKDARKAFNEEIKNSGLVVI